MMYLIYRLNKQKVDVRAPNFLFGCFSDANSSYGSSHIDSLDFVERNECDFVFTHAQINTLPFETSSIGFKDCFYSPAMPSNYAAMFLL
jgi:hypothetical protein